MGSVKPSKSDDTAANKPHPRTISSINIAGSSRLTAKTHLKARTAKSGLKPEKSAGKSAGKSYEKSTGKSTGKSSAKPSVKPSVKPSAKTHIPKPRSASSLRKTQRNRNHVVSQQTVQMRIPENISEHRKEHQGKFVDARSLPGLDFIKKALNQTSGSLGMITRPRIINFKERIKERKTAYLHFTLKRLIAVLLAIIVIIAMVWVLFFSPIFQLQSDDISISGSNEWVSEQQIASIASTQVNKSLFLVSSQEVINQLNSIAGVTEAKVTKDFPHGLQITIRAQRPAAMLKTRENNRLTAVDAKGRVLNAVSNATINGIPVIEVGDVRRSLNNRAVLEAVKIVSSLPESLRVRVTKVSAKTQDSVETELGGVKRTIVWGDSSQLELKKAIVAKIIDDPSKIGNRHRLDVSAPVRPILK